MFPTFWQAINNFLINFFEVFLGETKVRLESIKIFFFVNCQME